MPGATAASVDGREVRIEPEGLAVVLDGLIVGLLGEPGVTTIDVIGGFFWIEPDGLVEVLDRLFIVVLVEAIVAALSVVTSVFRRQLGLLDGADGGVFRR